MSARRQSAPNISRILAVVLVVVLLVAALGAFAYDEISDPRFALAKIDVIGERETPSPLILWAAGFTPGANVWLLDTAGAQRRIEALPWIDTARVERSWPNRVAIAVTERAPVARISLTADASSEEPGPGFALIDASMRVLALVSRAEQPSLPVFHITPQPGALEPGAATSDPDIESAYDAMVQLRALGLRISEVDMKPATGMTVRCADGLHVILGTEDDLAKKVTLLHAIAPNIVAPEHVVYVDLRSVRAPTVLYR